jgi:hypothetical protein
VPLEGGGADAAALAGVTRTFPAAFLVKEAPADAAAWAAGQAVPFEVQMLKLGPLAIVGIPAEPLNALGLAVRGLASPRTAGGGARGNTTSSGPARVWCAGYANGCYGYLPVREEYPRGGYEVESAHRHYGRPGPFAPDTAERVLAEAAAGIATLWRSEKEADASD